jgi:cob(I)alamin adenosyltransferase
MNKKKRKSITTKGGDKGNTSLFDGTRISKAALRPEVYGTLDEVSAFIGLARSKTDNPAHREALIKIQNLIYLVNAELACPEESKADLNKRFEGPHQKWVEEKAAELEQDLELPPKFILYGETEQSAWLDVARAVVRRGERAFTALAKAESVDNPHIQSFLNRLSDLLYLLARSAEREAGVAFRHPEV